jgi:small subunit ribosomal protein S2
LSKITLEQLLESGVHFGHQVHRWNPKMRSFIYGQKGGVHIFDLSKTVKYLDEALKFVQELSKEGKIILFVGTKRQAQDIICEEAERSDSPYVNQRWLGGTLTNFSTIKRQIKSLNDFEEDKKSGNWDKLIKKERLMLQRKLDKLQVNITGLRNLRAVPDAIFVTDVNREYIAIAEAKKLGIPIIAICDTNVNPEGITYPIPANDDAIKSLKFLVGLVADKIIKNKPKKDVEADDLIPEVVKKEGKVKEESQKLEIANKKK